MKKSKTVKKFAEVEKEILNIINKNVLTYKEYKLVPYVHQDFDRSTTGLKTRTVLYYNLTHDDGSNVHFTSDQLKALSQIMKMVDYNTTFEDIIK